MSLSISGSSPTYAPSKDAVVQENTPSETSASSSSTSTDSGNRYLGSYIASATAALSLLTQTASGEAAGAETPTSSQAGSAAQKDGVNLYQITSNLGKNGQTQAYSSTLNFSRENGKVQAQGNYDSSVSSAPASGATTSSGPASADLKVSVSLATGSSEFGQGTNAVIKVGNDPKNTDNVYLTNGTNLDDQSKQFFESSFQDFFKAAGLSSDDAKQQASQVADFLFSAARAVSTNQIPPAATASAASASSTSSSSSTSSTTA